MSGRHLTRTGTRRLGDDYQDLVALDLMIDWLEHSTYYKWIRVEADDAGSLDDIVLMKSDDRLVVNQVKFSTDPESETDRLTWEYLLDKPIGKSKRPGKSLLEKWSSSLELLKGSYEISDASLLSNRIPSSDVSSCLSLEGIIDLDKIADHAIRQEIIAQLGGESKARGFLSQFHFRLNQPGLIDLRNAIRKRFRKLGGSDGGWFNLGEELRLWVYYKEEPPPDGKITINHIRTAALWNELKGLPQQFEIPPDYTLPSRQMYDELLQQLLPMKTGCLVLTASPGLGKSTFVSYLYRELEKQNIPVIRHHYFLSLQDKAAYTRLESHRAAESLMHDLQRSFPDSVTDVASENPHPEKLREWLEAAGQYYAHRHESLIVIIDGLDHVWRDRRSTEQLDKLLGFLLPVPAGVTLLFATQPVDDDKLPPRFLRYAPRDSWLNLPPLSPQAVSQWVRHHRSELAQPEHYFYEISRAFYQKSGGHPLHLRYTLKALQEQGLTVDEYNIRRLPACSHDDITTYYGELWRSLSEESREILHLLAACGFTWPRQGVFDCLDPQGDRSAQVRSSLRQVRHMLIQDELGLKPFHGSLFAYVEGLAEYSEYREVMKRRALGWLQTNAPDYWRWAHEWVIKSDLGDDTDLINEPNRAWLVEAIAKCRPYERIDYILMRSTQCALNARNLVRTVKTGILREYAQMAFEYNSDVVQTLLYPQLAASEDASLHSRLRADRKEISDDALVLLAESEIASGNQEFAEDCFDELAERTNEPGDKQRREVEAMLEDVSRLAAMVDSVNPYKILDYAVRNRSNGYGKLILTAFVRQLRVRRNGPRLRRLISTSPRRMKLKFKLDQGERSVIIRDAVLLALEEELDFDTEVVKTAALRSPFSAIYIALRNTGKSKHVDIEFPSVELLSFKNIDFQVRDEKVSELLYSIFFCFLANHFAQRSDQNRAWLVDVPVDQWLSQFLWRLNEIADETRSLLQNGKAFALSLLYKRLKELPRLKWSEERDAYFIGFSTALEQAVRSIGLDLLSISGPRDNGPRITIEDLQAAFHSGYCYTQKWLTDYVDRRRAWLDESAVRWLIREQAEDLGTSIEEFPTRASRFILLASVATLHSLENEARANINLAAENLVAHGNHKDILFFGVIDSIKACHNAGIVEARDWLLNLAPAVAHIKEYTDTDETGDVPRRMADALAEVAPDLLPAYHRWLTESEEYYDALYAFRTFVRTADLKNPYNLAVVKTSVDENSLRVLSERAEGGNIEAASALQSLSDLLGYEALTIASSKETQSSTPSSEKQPIPFPKDYPPERFNDYLSALESSQSYLRDTDVHDWITHWINSGKQQAVYSALQETIGSGRGIRSYDAMFRLALSLSGKESAYQWLVAAHVDDYGWDEYMTRRENATHRWKYVRDLYRDKWFEFLATTLVPKYREDRGIFVYPRMFGRIVDYCLFMGHTELAKHVTSQILDSALELVSSVDLPQPGWVPLRD